MGLAPHVDSSCEHDAITMSATGLGYVGLVCLRVLRWCPSSLG